MDTDMRTHGQKQAEIDTDTHRQRQPQTDAQTQTEAQTATDGQTQTSKSAGRQTGRQSPDRQASDTQDFIAVFMCDGKQTLGTNNVLSKASFVFRRP